MVLRCLAFVLLLPTAAFAQEDWFGVSVGILGDLDGDGIAEFSVGDSGSYLIDGRAYVYSGATSAQVYSLSAPTPSEQTGSGYHADWFGGGAIQDAGDLNGDGTPDLFVGDPYGGQRNGDIDGFWEGRAYAFDGSNGEVLYRFEQPRPGGTLTWPYRTFGTQIERVGDLDGDGVDDVLVSAPDSGAGNGGRRAGQVIVSSGATGAWIRTDRGWPQGIGYGATFGRPLVLLDDIDGDGVRDYYSRMRATEHVITSGRTGDLLLTRDELLPDSDVSLQRVARVPDQDRDGLADIATLVVSPTFDIDSPTLFIYSSSTLDLIREFPLPGADENTQLFAFTTDGDRVAAVVKYSDDSPETISVVSLTTGEALFAIPTPPGVVGHDFGSVLAFHPDLTGDGISDLVVGAPRDTGTGTGLAFIFDGADGSEYLRLNAAGIVADEEVPSASALSVRVGPNPVRGRTAVTLTLPEAGVARVSVFDVLGRQVAMLADGALRAGETTLGLDASGWAPGVYLVRLATADGVQTTRLTVAR